MVTKQYAKIDVDSLLRHKDATLLSTSVLKVNTRGDNQYGDSEVTTRLRQTGITKL
jgi:hypothetical protein